MLSTAGEDPVAQEFAYAERPGDVSLEFWPVSAECPRATIPTVPSANAEAVPVEVVSAAVRDDDDVADDSVVAAAVAVVDEALLEGVAWRSKLPHPAAINNVATMPIDRRLDERRTLPMILIPQRQQMVPAPH